jgi:vancomycin aglycone glucosyltransferase
MAAFTALPAGDRVKPPGGALDEEGRSRRRRRSMEIGLAAEGTRGDVYPMLALGERLRALGHGVRVCASPDFAEAARTRGLAFHPVGESVRAYLTEKAAALHGGPLAMVREAHRYMRRSIALQFRDLEGALLGCDLVVGAGVQLAAHSLAELRGVPYRYVAYCPAILPSPHHPPFVVESQDWPAWANRLAWWLTLGVLKLGPGPVVNGARRRLGLGRVGDIGRYMLSPRPLLAADVALAPAPGDTPMPVDQVPCLHPFEPEALPAKLEAFLDSGPAPVYLGFGSMTDPQPAETTQRILDAIRSGGGRAVLSRGWAGLGEGPLPDGVFVTDAVSHAALFPRMAAVVHHGGAGTTTTAARAGVPQILLPHVLDQFYWARRVQRLGLGPPPIPRRALTTERLAAAIAETLENEILRERTIELGEELRARARDDGAVAALLRERDGG